MDDRVNPYAPPADESQAPPLVAEVVVDEAGWTIQYELAIEDAVAWNVHLHRTSPVMRRQLLWVRLGVAGLSVLLGLLCMLTLRASGGVATGFALIVFGGAFSVLVPLLQRRNVRRLITALYREGANYKLFGPRRVTLSDEYVISSSPLTQSIIRWQGIVDVRMTAEGLYLLFSSVDAIIVPLRAFASQAEFDRFAARARECHAHATQLAKGAIPR